MVENESKRRKVWLLFLTFLKIGAFTFGGGYAMIPLIQREICDNKKWISDSDILDIIAIAESTPGPIAINSATFVGFKVAGFWGAFFSTFGVVLPSFVIIAILSQVINAVQGFRAVKYAFMGIRAGVLALLVKALCNMYKQCPKNLIAYIIAVGAFIAVAVFDINVLIIIIGCAVVGLISSLVKKKEVEK